MIINVVIIIIMKQPPLNFDDVPHDWMKRKLII